MPIYEYRCDECRHLFEVLTTPATASAEISCSKCGSHKVKKTISASSFRINSGGTTIPTGALSGCSTKGGFS
ncbi:MAG: zinc ribbon domain-containing protein [Desulfobulbaceae bacterium]|nr:zinc ribbon domain-containing protein [Desulfobulbaceae bacterium]